ncbi:MAG: HlyD family secretion protein [Acidobacteria bacterium]|nr:MAG: HlyD family secretion protein [Acidobacteriota bacterium]
MATEKHPRSLLHARSFQVLAAVVVVIIVAIVLVANRSSAPTYFTAAVRTGNITSVVQATGVVNPINTVSIGAQVSGRITKINVDFNSRVKKGELIAQIDPTPYENALAAAKADLANAQAQVGVAQANVQDAKAKIEQAQAALQQATLQRDRSVSLYQQGIVSAAQRDTDVATFQTDQAAHSSAQAGLAQTEAALKSAQAAAKGKQSQVTTAETNLGYCNIYAPVDGVIINRAVDAGQTVASSFSAPLLFSEATDLDTMWVYMQTDESDEGRLKVGDPATFTVDAYPDTSYRGVVKQLRMNATTVQNVVEYDTIIEFKNSGQKLFPGMTAYVNIPVASALNTLEVPNSALRFKPSLTPVQLRTLLGQYGMQDSGNGAPQAKPAAGAHAPGQHATHPQVAGGQTNRPTTAILWTLDANHKLVPVKVRTGITDFTHTAVTQVLQGQLKAGDKVVTGELAKTASGLPGAGGGRPGR